jgi:uncharacterized membrane protein YeiH
MVLMNLLTVDGLAAVTNVLDLSGVFASALLGGSIARTMDFDLFGFLVVGFVSGLGGGLLRDVLLQNGPPVALTDPLYLPVAVLGALVAFFVSFSERTWDRLFTVLDAAVIGFWAVVGVQRTFDAGLEWPAAIIMAPSRRSAVGRCATCSCAACRRCSAATRSTRPSPSPRRS